MKIIDRYVLGQFLKLFFMSIAALVTLFIVISFIDLVDDFLAHQASPSLVVYFFLLKIPEAVFFMMPMAVLIASILTYSLLSRSRELIIMMSSGLSALRIVLPVLGAALALSYLSFLNGDLLLPPSWDKMHRIFKYDIRKQKNVKFGKQNRIWLKTEPGAIWTVSHLDAASGKLHGVTMLEFTPDMSHISTVVNARTAFKEDDIWIFENGTLRTFDGAGKFTEKPFKRKIVNYDVDIAAIKKSEKKTQAMSFGEIRAYISRIRNAGYDDTRYRVDMYVKVTFPLIGFVMAFIAVPFGLKTDRASGVLGGISIAVLLGFVFWFLFSMSVSLGHNGKLPPLMAAGGAHLLFLFAAGYMTISRYYLPSGAHGKARI
ncbi:MAG: hypothetical protein IEMM0002_0937 [bacterium]|nr:MAG: hypothetical protein IEMM0002_0937 [bacterium]